MKRINTNPQRESIQALHFLHTYPKLWKAVEALEEFQEGKNPKI